MKTAGLCAISTTFRAKQPWKAPASDVYLLIRAGLVLPVEEHSQLMQDWLAAAEAEDRPLRDNCRVVVTGLFCEQPPLNLIKSIELSGCYIVDDDLLLVTRWLLDDVPVDGDPMQNLADAFLHQSESTAAKYEPDVAGEGPAPGALGQTLRRRGRNLCLAQLLRPGTA